MNRREEILAWLQEEGAVYTLHEHPAAYTMDDMVAYKMMEKALIAKNLFLRDSKGKRHFLVMVAGDKQVDLKQMGEQLGTKLSFASPERLQTHLNLVQGEVSPLGLYYNQDRSVEVYLDQDLQGCAAIGVHPCDNTATVVLDFEVLKRLIDLRAKSCGLIEIPS